MRQFQAHSYKCREQCEARHRKQRAFRDDARCARAKVLFQGVIELRTSYVTALRVLLRLAHTVIWNYSAFNANLKPTFPDIDGFFGWHKRK